VNESQLWKKLNLIQKTKKKWHFVRIESATIRGIPDVNCCINGFEFWLELKANQVKNYGLSNYQINFHLTRQKSGGKVFILHSCTKEKGLKLLRVVDLVPGVLDHEHRSNFLASPAKDHGSCNHTSNHTDNHTDNHTSNHTDNHTSNHITSDHIHKQAIIFEDMGSCSWSNESIIQLFNDLIKK